MELETWSAEDSNIQTVVLQNQKTCTQYVAYKMTVTFSN